MERCREIWGIESRREKEKEVQSVAQRWIDSIGTSSENEWGRNLAEGVRDLGESSDDLVVILEGVLDKCLSMLEDSAKSIFPTTDLPPSRPSTSVIQILTAGREIFFTQPQAKQRIDELSDELRGLAIGEYVVAAESMGGLNKESSEGLEKVARWIEKEITNIRVSWGQGLGSYVDLHL